jgi:hypothetical protein
VQVEQGLHLGHALADFPERVVDHQWPLKLVSLVALNRRAGRPPSSPL